MLWWRTGFLLVGAALVFLWIRSWTRIDSKSFSMGSDYGTLTLAASDVAFTFRGGSFMHLNADDSNGSIPPGYFLDRQEVYWIDWDPAGTGKSKSLTTWDPESLWLSKTGSFSAKFHGFSRDPFKPFSLHVRFPIWLFLAALMVWWIWIERSVRRKRTTA